MMKLYIEQCRLTITIDNYFLIDEVRQERPNYRPFHGVRTLHDLRATAHENSSIIGETFVADGLACWALMIYIIDKYPTHGPRMHFTQFYNLFSNNAEDAIKTVLRIFNGNWRAAPGEYDYFCQQQFRNHPAYMSDIAEAGRVARLSRSMNIKSDGEHRDA